MTPWSPIVHHIEQYQKQFCIMVLEDTDGLYAHAFHIVTLDPVLLEARGFPSIDHGIKTCRRTIDRILKNLNGL